MAGYDALRVAPHEVRGPAIGGPCDGGRLIASNYWDGRIRNRRLSSKTTTIFLVGHYVWDAKTLTWTWTEEVPDVQPRSEAA